MPVNWNQNWNQQYWGPNATRNPGFLGSNTPGGILGLNRIFNPNQFALGQTTGSVLPGSVQPGAHTPVPPSYTTIPGATPSGPGRNRPTALQNFTDRGNIGASRPYGTGGTTLQVPAGGDLTNQVDNDLNAFLTDLEESLWESQSYNQTAKDTAIARLLGGTIGNVDNPYTTNVDESLTPGVNFGSGWAGRIGEFYDPLISRAETEIPLNPFSDEFRSQLETAATDDINRMQQQELNTAGLNLASRGLSSGGTTAQTAAGGAYSRGLEARIGARNELAGAQLDFNTKSNLARNQFLGSLTSAKTEAMGQAQGLAAQIQAGNLVDPEAGVNLLEGVYGLQMTRDNMARFEDELQQLAKTNPAEMGAWFSGLAQLLLPSAGRFTSIPQLMGSYPGGGSPWWGGA